MKKQEASYTVELSLLLPVLLFVLFTPLYMGYQMYEKTARASVCGWDKDFHAVGRVREINFAGKFLEELK